MNLTSTQRLIYNLLQDGYPHSANELCQAVGGNLSDRHCIEVHVYNMRRTLAKHGLDIVGRCGSYQMMRHLHSAYDGKR